MTLTIPLTSQVISILDPLKRQKNPTIKVNLKPSFRTMPIFTPPRKTDILEGDIKKKKLLVNGLLARNCPLTPKTLNSILRCLIKHKKELAKLPGSVFLRVNTRVAQCYLAVHSPIDISIIILDINNRDAFIRSETDTTVVKMWPITKQVILAAAISRLTAPTKAPISKKAASKRFGAVLKSPELYSILECDTGQQLIITTYNKPIT